MRCRWKCRLVYLCLISELALADIETRQARPVSPMSVGLLSSLTEAEILDLLEYLRVGRR